VNSFARRGRLWLAIAGCAIVLSLLPASRDAERHFDTAARIEGSEAQAVGVELAERFHSPFVERLLLVVRGVPAADSAGGREALTVIGDAMRAQPGVAGVVSYVDWPDPIFLGKDGGTFVMVGLSAAGGPAEPLIPPLRNAIGDVQRTLRSHFPGATLSLTGETPLNFDIRKASSDDARLAEIRILPVLIILLLIAFGSVSAATLPLIMGFLAILVTMGSAALFARYWHLSILVRNLATMMGLGLGVDYALLMVSRFREELGAGKDASAAADGAMRHAGHTLLISASTVAIGFAALLTIPISDIRSIGVAGFFVTAASLLLAVTILPEILALIGHRIDKGRLPFAAGATASALRRQRWRAMAAFVTRHPWGALVLAGVPLLVLALYSLRLSPGLPRDDWLPPHAESVRALHSLEAMDRAAIVQSLRVVLELPRGVTIETEEGWMAAERVARRLTRDRRAERVISLPTLLGEGRGAAFLPLVPEQTRQSFLRDDRRATLFEVLPRTSVSSSAQEAWVRELRTMDVAALSGVPGASIRVGGIPALNVDYAGTVANRFGAVMAWVVGGTFLVLVAGFRSLLVALKAIVLNLLSVGAALGLLVVVFQDGHGSRMFGLATGTGGVFPIVPILTFAIVFGLSMDYEVFLVARVLEARRRGLAESEAIAEGVSQSAGIITSAAAIMITVFAAFAFGSFLVIQMVGFALAAAVFIDATLVRIVIEPALLALAGEWNWWPGGLHGVRHN
jgi:RND superfamily putative drug exporter